MVVYMGKIQSCVTRLKNQDLLQSLHASYTINMVVIIFQKLLLSNGK